MTFTKTLLMAAFSTSLALAVLPPTPISAHTKVSKSVPEDGATVAPGVENIELLFAGKMRLTVFKIKNSGTGKAISPTAPLPSKFVSKANVNVPPLENGDYEISWVGVGTDGHVMTGRFNFSVSEE